MSTITYLAGDPEGSFFTAYLVVAQNRKQTQNFHV